MAPLYTWAISVFWQGNWGKTTQEDFDSDQTSRSSSDNTVHLTSLLFRETLNKQTEYRYDLLNADYDQSKTKDFTIKKYMLSFMSQVKLPQD